MASSKNCSTCALCPISRDHSRIDCIHYVPRDLDTDFYYSIKFCPISCTKVETKPIDPFFKDLGWYILDFIWKKQYRDRLRKNWLSRPKYGPKQQFKRKKLKDASLSAKTRCIEHPCPDRTGIPHTEASKKKMSESLKNYWAKRKAKEKENLNK